jgi:hypothetical protein
MIAPAMLPVISRDADHYDSQIYAVCGGGALLPSGGFDCCERRSQRNSSAYSQRSEARTDFCCCHSILMRTLTAYGIGVVIVLAVLNGIAWQAGSPRLHDINVFSAGFALGVLGTYISAWLNGYRRVA